MIPMSTALAVGRLARPVALACAIALSLLVSTTGAQGDSVRFQEESACQTLTMGSAGGPMPRHRNLLVIRWLGRANHEVLFRNNVILINAWYQVTPPGRPLGFDMRDITRANAVLIGQGHGDHIADAAQVARQTGALLIGGPPSADFLRTVEVPEKQIVSVTGRGGEIQRFTGMTVEPVLALHHDPDVREPGWVRATAAAFRAIMDGAGLTRTREQQEQNRRLFQGTSDPRVIDEGTIAFLLTFGPDFRLMFRDGVGTATEYERNLMRRIGGRTDVAVQAYSTYHPERMIKFVLPLVMLFAPRVYMPTHHDDMNGGRLDTPVEPLFMAIRDELPDVRSISPLYRTPVCFDVVTRDVYVGR